MSVLLWLLIPVAGVLIGAGWVAWRSRPKRTPDAAEGLAQMVALRQAMTQPMPDVVRQKREIAVQTAAADEDPEVSKPASSTFRKSA